MRQVCTFVDCHGIDLGRLQGRLVRGLGSFFLLQRKQLLLSRLLVIARHGRGHFFSLKRDKGTPVVCWTRGRQLR